MTTEAPSSFTFDGLAAVIPFPAVFPLVCQACQQCVKEAAFKRDIIRHSKVCRQRPVNSQPATDTVFECTHCGFRAADRRKATTHQASHFGDPQYALRKYSCNKCTRDFATQKALSSHINQCGQSTKATNVRVPAVTGVPRILHEPAQSRPNTDEIVNAGPPCYEQRTSASRRPSFREHAGDVPSANMLSSLTSREESAQPVAAEGESRGVTMRPTMPQEFPVATEVTNMSFDSVSTTMFFDDVCADFNEYNPPNGRNPLFDCDQWLLKLIPPRMRKKHKPFNVVSPKMNERELQALYTKQPKRALDKLQFIPNIECKVDPVDLRHGLLLQLQSQNPTIVSEQLWYRCPEGLEELASPFREDEIQRAMSHANSAPGPDGWKYDMLAKQKNFAKNFVEGLHQMAATAITPDSWRSYNSMLLFKKPDEYVPGQETILKNFRPIALSNTSYKILTATLCKRLSKWLERNKGISFSQRAVFSRHGLQENTLYVAEALKQKKCVLFLDLSDAFNSIEHCFIYAALEQSGCPEWIVRLIKSLYSGCTTVPVDQSGNQLADLVPVTRGVRQGCPLSGLVFNLVLDPTIHKITNSTTTCLGYMDDLAVITDASSLPGVLKEIESLAARLGLTFNPKKCGVANYEPSLMLAGEQIPIVDESHSYKYLGTEAGSTTLGGLEQKFAKTWKVAELIEMSALTPMQKLHALRTYILPKLMHLLENAHSTQKQIQRMNRDLRKMVKRICHLPERATNSYIHLHRRYGGPGLPNLELLKAKLTIQTFTRAVNLADEFGNAVRSLLFKGKSSDEIMQQINNRSRVGLSQLCNDVVHAMRKLESFLEVQMSFCTSDNQVFS